MSGSLNKVMIIGNVGRDAEMRYLQSGKAFTRFSVAVNSRWHGDDGTLQEHTEWFRVVAWERLAETCGQYVTKGRTVFVEGRLRTNSFDGQDGQKHTMTELVATNISLLDRRPDGAQAPENDAAFPAREPVTTPDDAPF
jgi:single-strand DNA-binding protein